MPTLPRITIALCTYNGAAHLQEQLDSYLGQDHGDWDLWVSDDGSSDDTLNILNRFRAAESHRRDIRILQGPGKGPAANYLSLLNHPDLPEAPVALSDQDDVWFPGKLTRALERLATAPAVTLYGAQSRHTDDALNVIGASRPPRRTPGFRNALTQNVVSGHSATLSPEALRLVRRAGVPDGIAYHDWWLYQLISGAGGSVVIDEAAVLYYRQHGTNAMGAHQGLYATLERISQVFDRTYGDWIAANLRELDRSADLLTPGNRQIVADLRQLPRRPGFRRWRALRRIGLHRQTRAATIAFYLAVALGRV